MLNWNFLFSINTIVGKWGISAFFFSFYLWWKWGCTINENYIYHALVMRMGIVFGKNYGKFCEMIESKKMLENFFKFQCSKFFLIFSLSRWLIICNVTFSYHRLGALAACVWVHKNRVQKPTSFVEQQPYHENDNGMVMTTTIRMIVKRCTFKYLNFSSLAMDGIRWIPYVMFTAPHRTASLHTNLASNGIWGGKERKPAKPTEIDWWCKYLAWKCVGQLSNFGEIKFCGIFSIKLMFE